MTDLDSFPLDRDPAPIEADLIGKTVRITETDWSEDVGLVGKAIWDRRGYPHYEGGKGKDHHWVVYPDVSSPQWSGNGRWCKRVELVEAEPFSATEAAAAVFKGKLCRITETPWPWNIGEVGYAVWHPEGMAGRPDVRWMLAREPGGTSGYWAKNIELVADDATLTKEDAPMMLDPTPLPFERRAQALKWAKDTYPDGTDIDHMEVADWLLKDEEDTVTYPIYHPPASEQKDPELPKRVEFRDSGDHTLTVESNDGADSDDEVATLHLDGSPGYLTALRAKRVIEVLQRAINRA